MVGFRVPGTTALVYMDSGTISCILYRYIIVLTLLQRCLRHAIGQHHVIYRCLHYIYLFYICIYIYVYVSFYILINHWDQSKPLYRPFLFFLVVAASMERYVNLTCALCGENLYTDLCDFVEAAGSQPHLDRYLGSRREPQVNGVSWFP